MFLSRPRRSDLAGVFALLAVNWLVLPDAGAESQAAEAANPTRGYREVLELSSTHAYGTPVRFEGSVTYSDDDKHTLFLQDGNGSVMVQYVSHLLHPVIGDRVLADGVIGLGDYEPAIIRSNLTLLARGASLPAPRLRDPGQFSLADDGSWAETTGYVRSVDRQTGQIRLFLESAENWIEVLIAGPVPADWDTELRNARVRVKGMCRVRHGDGKEPVQVALYVPAPTLLQIVQAASPDPYDLPVRNIADLPLPTDQADTRLPVHLRGRIQKRVEGRRFVLRDPTGEVEVELPGASKVNPGMLTDFVGTVVAMAPQPLLRATAYRCVGFDSGNYVRDADVASLPPLDSVEKIRALTPVEAAKGYSVKFRAVVSYYDTEWGSTFVQDEAAGIFVITNTQFKLDLREGQDVLVEGITSPGSFAPMIQKPRFEILGHRPRLRGQQILFRDINGSMDSQLLQIRGVVRAVTSEPHHFTLSVMQGSDLFVVEVQNPERRPVPEQLIGATVNLRGLCSAVTNPQRQFTGARILVSRLEDIRIESRNLPADAFALPVGSIGSLLQFAADPESSKLVRVRGIVTYHQPGDFLYLQDESGCMLARLAQAAAVKTGEIVDVVGFAETENYLPVIVQARVRSTGTRGNVTAIVLKSSAEALNVSDVDRKSYAGRLIRVRGRLLDRSGNLAEKILTLQDESTTYTASMVDGARDEFWTTLEVGSMLEVTGVCAPVVGHDQIVTTFRLLLPSRASVRVVERAPWWKPRHTIAAITGVVLLGLMAAGWVVSLRRQVAGQTRIIVERLERERTLETRYRELFENNPNPMWVHAVATRRFLAVNEAAASHYGYTAEEFSQMLTSDLDAPGNSAEVPDSGGSRISATPVHRHRRKNGDLIHVELREKTLTFANQSACIVLVHDVTSRLQAEAELDLLQTQLREQSHTAGMAVVAENVLHNLGNVLNSINVSANLTRDQVKSSKVGKVRLISRLLGEHQADLPGFFNRDPRGAQSVAYLATLADQLEAEQRSLLGEVESLQGHIDAVKMIVARQQDYAGAKEQRETVGVAVLLNEAVRLRAQDFTRAGIAITRDGLPQQTISIDRHKAIRLLLQVLEEAEDSCRRAGPAGRRIAVAAAVESGVVNIRITDNGAGFSDAEAARLFQQDYRSSGGLGRISSLHEAALNAKALGGSVTATSPGAGQGETFCITLPLGTA